MKKFLLSILAALPALSMSADPVSPLYIVGLNGIAEADPSMELTLQTDRSEDDIDEEIFRYSNPEITISQAGAINIVSADKSFSLGYSPENLMGSSNDLSATAPMMYIYENGDPINCTLAEGRYSVSLVLFGEDPESPEWVIQFTSLDSGDDNGNFYLLGFGEDGDIPSNANKFVKTVTEEDGETVITYSLPKFYVEECPDGFTVYDIDNDISYGADDAEVTDDMPFAMLSPEGKPVKSSMKAGYYSVNFISTGGMAMISFLLCEDQSAADEAEYYLIGFNGVTEPTDAVKFTRSVETMEYEDEGEMYSETVISYDLKEFAITGCEEGFTVSTASGDFSYGLDPTFAPMFGTSVTDGFGFLGIYGEPMGWAMENGVYDISFTVANGGSAMISFVLHDDTGVAEVESSSEDTPVYYNLQGVRVANPENGVFIRSQGGKTTKVVIR